MSWRASAYAKETRGHKNLSTKAVLMVLADYHNEAQGFAWCSQARLADDCECSVRTIREALKTLEAMGFITQTKKGNQFQPSNWVFNFDGAQAHVPEVSGNVTFESEAAESAGASTMEPKKIPKQRQSSVSEAEAPRHTNLQQPPQVPIVQLVMDNLEGIRGYVSTRYGAEAKAVKEMEKLNYSADDILKCYGEMKTDKFWINKALTMMSVLSNIGEWKEKKQPKGSVVEDRNKYANQNVPPRRGSDPARSH